MQTTNIASYRVLFISEMFCRRMGGAEISAFIVLSELAHRGLNVSVLTHRFSGTKPHEFSSNIMINREEFFSEHRLLFYLRAIFAITRYIVRYKPHVIVTQQIVSPLAIALSKVFNIPVIVLIHDYWPICHNRTLLKPNREICSSYDTNVKEIYACVKEVIGAERLIHLKPLLAVPKSVLVFFHTLISKQLLKYADAVVANSLFLKEVLTANGFATRKIKVIYPPIAHALADNKDDAFANSSSIILYVGRLDPEKGIDILLKAMQHVKMKLDGVEVFVVGGGRQESNLRSLAKDLQVEDRVRFLGWVSHKTLKFLYKSSTVVVVPSIWNEPFGRVVVEAMTHGTPVVASNVGGISELVSPENGILVPPGNTVALAEALTYLITQKRSFKSNPLGLERFLPERIAALMLDVIEETVET